MENALTFLSTLLYWSLTIYEWIIILAILLSWVNPDPSNPVMQFLNSMTLPFWNWLRLYLPGQLRLFTAYVSLLVIWFLKIFLPGSVGTLGVGLAGGISEMALATRIFGFFLLGVGIVMQNFLFFLILLFLVWFFLTLVNPSTNNPIVRTVYFLVDPFITPVQHRLPRMRIDFSPLIVAGIFLLINMFVLVYLIAFAVQLTGYQSVNLPAEQIR